MANSDTGGNHSPEDFKAPDFRAPEFQAPEQPEPGMLGGEAMEPAAEKLTDFEAPPQLELGDDDVRLPWLEGDDEDGEDNRSGSGQGLLLALLGLLALGVIAGGIFMVTRDKPDEQLVADGAREAAPGGAVVAVQVEQTLAIEGG